MEISPLDLLLLLGFAARLIRLAVVDDIADPFRAWSVATVDRHLGGRAGEWMVALWGCPFCVGFWISVGVVASWALVGDTAGWRLTAVAFTLSYAAGHLVARLDAEDDR